MEQPRDDDVRGLARGGRGAPRLVGDVYGIGRLVWSAGQRPPSARGRPVGPPSQNLPLTTFQDRWALLSPVSEWVPADTVCLSTASHFEIYPGVRDGVRQIATSAVDFETPAAEIETRPTCHIPICRLIAVAPISTARSRPALPR